jgi:hypothetical protein
MRRNLDRRTLLVLEGILGESVVSVGVGRGRLCDRQVARSGRPRRCYSDCGVSAIHPVDQSFANLYCTAV